MSAAAYWPWWAGAAALGAITVGFWIAVHRPLGVTGVLARFVNLREEVQAERRDAALSDEAALTAALVAATRESFGDAMPPSLTPLPMPAVRLAGARPRLAAHALLLGGIVAGGLASRLLRGGLADSGPGDAYVRIVCGGWRACAVLVLGGALVGFGTTLAGGCSSGHGLFGCARLQPGSLLATASFLGAAVGVSLLLQGGF
jgi:uncharacterized membrane protein YedE/YeeE